MLLYLIIIEALGIIGDKGKGKAGTKVAIVFPKIYARVNRIH